MFKEKYIKGHPIYGQGLKFKKDPIAFFEWISAQNQGVQKFRFGPLKMVNLSHPELIKYVMQKHNKKYHKGIEYDHLKPVLGNGLLNNEGESWFKQRRLAQPAFYKEKMLFFKEVMLSSTQKKINEIIQLKETDIHDQMMRLTMEIVSKTMFGVTVEADEEKVENALAIAIEKSYARVQKVFNTPLWLPTSSNLKYKQSIDDLDEVVNGIINKRSETKERSTDLLDMLMYAEDEDTGEKMNPKQLRDEVMTIFLAGHETTANALSWAFYALDQNKEVKTKLLRELKENSWEISTPYLLWVIKETLRLYPPAWALGRRCIEDDEFEGVQIKKGENITISTYVIHRNPDFWPQADVFMPERFKDEKAFDKFQYFPFGGGPRFCIGNNFAIMEMQIILTEFLKSTSLDVKNETELEPLITLRPKGGIHVKINRTSLTQ